MKIQLHREQLLSALQAVEPLVGRALSDVQKHAKLHVSGAKATLIASNADVHVWQDLECAEGPHSVDVLLPVQMAVKMCKFLVGDSVIIELSEGKSFLTISDGGNSYKLATVDPTTWPDTPRRVLDDAIVLPANQFAQILTRTWHCCDDASARFALGAVALSLSRQMSPGGPILRAWSTDTRRFAISGRPCEMTADPPQQMALLPKKAIAILLRAIGDTPADLRVWWDDKSVFISLPGVVTIRARQVEGRFPDLDAVAQDPKDVGVQSTLACGAWRQLCSAAGVLLNEESRGADFVFEAKELRVRASTPTGEVEFSEIIDHDMRSKEYQKLGHLTVTLDPALVQSYLACLSAVTAVQASLTDRENVVVWRPQDGTQDTDSYGLMPLSSDR